MVCSSPFNDIIDSYDTRCFSEQLDVLFVGDLEDMSAVVARVEEWETFGTVGIL
jgi:hypothetical protein